MEKKKDSPRIAIIIGTRAELIKTFPLMLELQKKKIPYYFINTGQNDTGIESICDLFGVRRPDVVLSKPPKKDSKFKGVGLRGVLWNLGIIKNIRKELKRLGDLEYVVYHGDTMTTTSAALASSRLLNPFKKFKNVHLEAGLRSWNNWEPFPEEISRRIAGRFSDILLAVSPQSKKNLERDGRKSIVLTGNTIIDAAHIAYEISKKRNTEPLSKKPFALVSIHRYENIKSKRRLGKIVEILKTIDVPAYFTMHGNTKRRLEEFGLMGSLKENENIKILPPMDYPNYIMQIAKCSLIVCDGGSLQEESLIFRKPCVILRKSTERQEGLDSNFQFLSNLDVEKSKEMIRLYLHPTFKPKKFDNPYGKKGLTKRIVREVFG